MSWFEGANGGDVAREIREDHAAEIHAAVLALWATVPTGKNDYGLKLALRTRDTTAAVAAIDAQVACGWPKWAARVVAASDAMIAAHGAYVAACDAADVRRDARTEQEAIAEAARRAKYAANHRPVRA